jgi:hypothetical protein
VRRPDASFSGEGPAERPAAGPFPGLPLARLSHLVDGRATTIVDLAPARLGVDGLGLVDRRLAVLELVALVREPARLVQLPAQLVGARVAHLRRRGGLRPAAEKDARERETAGKRKEASHRATRPCMS